MFGLSLSKLLVLLIVCGAVWYGLKYLKVRERALARDAQRAAADRTSRAASGAAAGGVGQAAAVAEDLSKCPVCATYVARGAHGCGRADCPQA
jgi:hypothetical protein